MTEPTLFLGAGAFTRGKPVDTDQFSFVTVTYTDGTTESIWHPNDMSAIDFALTANWLKSRVGSDATMSKIEFDR